MSDHSKYAYTYTHMLTELSLILHYKINFKLNLVPQTLTFKVEIIRDFRYKPLDLRW
jgi:hypothetical protein